MAQRTGITADINDMLDIEQRLGRFAGDAPRLVAGVLNQAARRTRTQIKRQTRQELNLKPASIDRRFSIRFASRGNLQAVVVGKEKNPPLLTSFTGTRQTKKQGVTARPRKGVTEQHPTAFIAKGRGGVDVPFRRRVTNNKRAPRHPLVPVFGPSPIGLMIGQPGFADRIEQDMGEYVEQRIDGAIRGLLARRMAR